MREIRLTAVAGAAAVLLGANVAAATPAAQSVTIAVSAAERSITAPGPVTFSPAAGEVLGTPSQLGIAASSNSVVSWSNPPGQSTAVISVARDGADLGQLVLLARAAGAELNPGFNVDFAFTNLNDFTYASNEANDRPLLTDIVAGGQNSSATIVWRLTGTAPASGPIVTQFTYTIASQ